MLRIDGKIPRAFVLSNSGNLVIIEDFLLNVFNLRYQKELIGNDQFLYWLGEKPSRIPSLSLGNIQNVIFTTEHEH